MIVFKSNHCWEVVNGLPYTNYTDYPDEDIWIVHDDSELGQKIRSLGNRWTEVLDDNGNLIDVTWNGQEPPAPAAHTPTAEEDQNAMLVDHEYRLTLLELGVQ